MHVATFSEPSTLARKTSKKKGTKRGVEWAHHVFLKMRWCCFQKKISKKLSKLVPACRNYSLPNLTRFMETQCRNKSIQVKPRWNAISLADSKPGECVRYRKVVLRCGPARQCAVAWSPVEGVRWQKLRPADLLRCDLQTQRALDIGSVFTWDE